jgi:predicted MPP superfamily phosphohydrolase
MKIKGKFAAAFMLLAVALTAYTAYDNSRIVVKEQIVYVDNLPEAFDNFRILQISDLEGKRFGKGQSKLIGLVNSLDYDMLAFTGDMESNRTISLDAFFELLNGIRNREYMFYVNGNDDYAYSSLAGNVYEAGKRLEENGCILLTEPYKLEMDGQALWIANYFTKTDTGHLRHSRDVFLGDQEEYAVYKEYSARLDKIFSEIKDNGEIKIAVTHMPFLKELLRMDPDEYLDYSLILAGHYHGGQFRIPFYGALFIPSTRTAPSTLFPDQKDVSGLVEYDGIQQYVSAGLGASIVPFRLFDTPEINLITLKAK